MAWLSSELSAHRSGSFAEGDLKHFVQEYLRTRAKTDKLVCQAVKNGRVEIRVYSPVVQHIVHLAERDLRHALQHQMGYQLKKLKVFL